MHRKSNPNAKREIVSIELNKFPRHQKKVDVARNLKRIEMKNRNLSSQKLAVS
jgi:hypothetical protein